MELTFRTATPTERLYTASQSMQLKGQTGCVGHLRADTGMDAQGFLKKWQTYQLNSDNEEFKREFEVVMNALVSDGQYGGFLKSRDAMRDFCQGHPESSFKDGFAFGFRADTAQYSYLIRLNPYKEENTLILYCYRRDWLDQHIEQARQGIRFITPHYEEKFRIPDGDQIRISYPDGDTRDRTARYIDEYHVEIGSGFSSNLYHICEMAEILERSGGTVIPLRSSLPERCFVYVESTDEIGIVTRGEMGYSPTQMNPEGVSKRLADLCVMYGIEDKDHHRALNDAFVTHKLYEKLCEIYENEEEGIIFKPEMLVCKPYKDKEAPKGQIKFLKELLRYHNLTSEYDIDKMSQREVSRYVDKIILNYGRMK